MTVTAVVIGDPEISFETKGLAAVYSLFNFTDKVYEPVFEGEYVTEYRPFDECPGVTLPVTGPVYVNVYAYVGL